MQLQAAKQAEEARVAALEKQLQALQVGGPHTDHWNQGISYG